MAVPCNHDRSRALASCNFRSENMQKKRSLKFSMIIAGSVAGAAMLAAVPAQAQENPVGAVLGAAAAIAAAPFMWGGHRYCWYEGWNGPGWYWCGYGARRGYGWGAAMDGMVIIIAADTVAAIWVDTMAVTW